MHGIGPCFARSLAFAALLLTLAAPVHAQDPPGVPTPTPAAPGAQPLSGATGTTPGQAFLRALLIPGWGHASIGAYTRGGFYFITETAAAWMMVRTHTRLSAAKDVRDLRLSALRARLEGEGVTEPSDIIAREDADEGLQQARALVESRGQQFEDWLVLGVFLAFLGGADAFVTAHLQDFPDPVGLELRPSGDGFSVGGRIGLGGRR